MIRISIELGDEVTSILKKRGEKNFLSLKEQIEDILRRSAVSYKKGVTTRTLKVDDKLVDIFSRQKSGKRKK